MKLLLEALGIGPNADGSWGSVNINITQGPKEAAPQIILVAQPSIPEELAKGHQSLAVKIVDAINTGKPVNI